MSATAIGINVDARDLMRLTRNLREYIKVNKRSEDELLNKKGNDLRIQLYRGFWAQRWKAKKGGGFRLLKALVASGKGFLVRKMQLVEPWASQVPQTDKKGRALNEYQKLVAQEATRRQAGAGVLGVSFLRKRWAYKKEARYLTENRTRGFGKAVTFEKRDGEFIITGFTPGLARVAQKYGIISGAIQRMSTDIESYLAKKLGPEFVQNLHKA